MTNSFSRMQQKQSLGFFFSPFPLRIDACVHSLIRMYWFHSLGQKSEVWASMAKKNFADTESAQPLGQIQMILRWFWQPPLTEIYYPCCALKQKAKHIHNAGIPKNKNKNKKLGEEKKASWWAWAGSTPSSTFQTTDGSIQRFNIKTYKLQQQQRQICIYIYNT